MRFKKLKQIELENFFIHLFELPQIREFAYEILKDLCNKEGVYFFEVPNSIINKDNGKASGKYLCIDNTTLEEMYELTKERLETGSLLIDEYDTYDLHFPKIQINTESEYYNNFMICYTLAHELGHHMIHINNEKQSEDLADEYSVKIFKKYLPKFFIAMSYIGLKIKFNIKKNTIKDFSEYYDDYKIFRNNHPELILPLLEN